jgi:AraC family transcriptional regulator of adaptative response/methylated-DNA-[protein]-cysteine methyltransferase
MSRWTCGTAEYEKEKDMETGAIDIGLERRVMDREPQRCARERGVPAGAAEEIWFVVRKCSLGLLLVAQSGEGLCIVLLGDERDVLVSDLRRRFAGAMLVDDGGKVDALAGRVAAYVDRPAGRLDVALDMRGTEFQRAVWRTLCEIPAGSTASYTDIARRIGRPSEVRAVARACGANPLSVVVPCHRVVRRDGSLSGYRWGIERKRVLLEREGMV